MVGWVGGYQHRKMKANATAEVASERLLAERAAELPGDLKAIRALAEMLEPRLSQQRDQLQTALLLRNMLHHRVNLHSAKFEGYDFTDLDATFARSVLNPAYGHLCGGISIQFIAALRAFGIPARKVGMYPAASDLDDIAISHASVDVLINGRWVAMDPTFNTAFKNDRGEYIGWFDVRHTLRNGGRVVETPDEFTPKKNTTFEQYLAETHSTLLEVTKFMNAAPYLNGKTEEAIVAPPEWDGVLRYRNKSVYNVLQADSVGVYWLLANETTRAP